MGHVGRLGQIGPEGLFPCCLTVTAWKQAFRITESAQQPPGRREKTGNYTPVKPDIGGGEDAGVNYKR